MEVEAELVEEGEEQQVVVEQEQVQVQEQGREVGAATFIAPAAEAAEAEVVGGLPWLLRSPSLAALYVIVGHGAPANGSG